MSVELNDTEFSRLSFNMTVSNKYPTAIVYNLSSVGAATVNPFIEGDDSVQMDTIYTTNFGSVQFFNGHSYCTQMLLSAPAGRSAVVRVKFSPPADAAPELFPIFSGYVTVTTTGLASGNPKISVPYAGMVGRWKRAAVWSRKRMTGVYDPFTFEGISDGDSVSATDGAVLLLAASKSSRFGQVEEVVKHADNSRYIALLGSCFNLNRNTFNFLPTSRRLSSKSDAVSARSHGSYRATSCLFDLLRAVEWLGDIQTRHPLT